MYYITLSLFNVSRFVMIEEEVICSSRTNNSIDDPVNQSGSWQYDLTISFIAAYLGSSDNSFTVLKSENIFVLSFKFVEIEVNLV